MDTKVYMMFSSDRMGLYNTLYRPDHFCSPCGSKMRVKVYRLGGLEKEVVLPRWLQRLDRPGSGVEAE